MLCLNCVHARDGIPEKVVVEVRVDEEVKRVDITSELEELWKAIKRRGYTVIVFCDAKKRIRVGTPPSPASTVTECEEFTEA